VLDDGLQDGSCLVDRIVRYIGQALPELDQLGLDLLLNLETRGTRTKADNEVKGVSFVN